MSQAATVINTLDPLISLGFDLEDINGLLNDLEIPFSDEIADFARRRHNSLGGNYIPPKTGSGSIPFVSPNISQGPQGLFS